MCAVPSVAVFLQCFDFVLSRCLAQVVSELFSDGYGFPWSHLSFYILHKLYFSCKFFIFYNLIGFCFDHISASWNCACVNMHVPFHYHGLLLRMVLSVCVCLFHNLVTLTSRLVFNNFVHDHTAPHCLISRIFPCICYSVFKHTLLLCLLVYCSFANIGLANIMW